MPAGNFSFDPPSIPLGRPADQVGVFLYKDNSSDRGALGDGGKWWLEALPNVHCTNITIREDDHAPIATFRYEFNPAILGDDLPSRIQHVYTGAQAGPGKVKMDDRIVVVRDMGDGDWIYLFSGFVTQPQAQLDGDSENVVITAMGDPHREFDFVLPGAFCVGEESFAAKPAGTPATETDIPARFNPLGKPNACILDLENSAPPYWGDDEKIPFFVSPTFNDKMGPQDDRRSIRPWTLGMAVRYVVGIGIAYPLGYNKDNTPIIGDDNSVSDGTLPYVKVYGFATFDDLFKAIVPKVAGGEVNLNDPATYDKVDIICPDVEVTGETWPRAVAKLIRPYGFHFRFDLRRDPDDDRPEWLIKFYREDSTTMVVDAKLQLDGKDLDPGKSNVGSVRIARDAVHVANEFDVDTSPVRYEATFILNPAFPMADGDLSDLTQWIGETTDPTQRHYYRRFIFGEGGDSVWVTVDKKWVQTRSAMNQIFNIEKDADKRDKPLPLVRKRIPIGRMITKHPGGDPYRPQLHITNTNGTNLGTNKLGGLWDGSGTWQRIYDTSWKLLDDQIGIELTCHDPNSWHAGDPDKQFPAATDVFGTNGLLNVVEMSNPAHSAGTPFIIFALTCVVESDYSIDYLATRRPASLTKFKIRKRLDHRDRWKREVVTKYSLLANQALGAGAFNGVDWVAVRDDTDKIKDIVVGIQRSHECGSHAGSVTIPRLTTAYNVGQTLRGVVGRDISLQVNSNASTKESPIYPRIQSISWSLDGGQVTQLSLTDERAQRLSRRVSLQSHAHREG